MKLGKDEASMGICGNPVKTSVFSVNDNIHPGERISCESVSYNSLLNKKTITDHCSSFLTGTYIRDLNEN